MSFVRRLHRPIRLASDVRVAGDDKRTRFILDLDRKIDLRAFALANPNRIVVDIPQVTFQLPEGVGDASRGLVKAFRYGLVMPGGSRIVMDLKRPAKIDKAYVLDGENGQPPELIVELSAIDRTAFMQASPPRIARRWQRRRLRRPQHRWSQALTPTTGVRW